MKKLNTNHSQRRDTTYIPAKRIPEARHSKTLRRASPAPMGRFPVPMAFSQISSSGCRTQEGGLLHLRLLFLNSPRHILKHIKNILLRIIYYLTFPIFKKRLKAKLLFLPSLRNSGIYES